MFEKGTRGYAKVDPYRKTIKISKKVSSTVGTALEDTIKLFAKSFIQNNLAEHKNSILSHYLILSGPKTIDSLETRLRVLIICRNNPELLEKIQIDHHFQQTFIERQILNDPLLPLKMGVKA